MQEAVNSSTALLRTKCSPQIDAYKTDNNINDNPTAIITVQADKQVPKNEADNSDSSNQPYTSYLWYDTSTANYHGDLVVEGCTLDARYPRLAPLYWTWQEVYEEPFEK